MSAQHWVDLRRPRDVGALLSDGFGTYFRNFSTFLALAAVVVVPVQLILSGIGLKQLWAHYDKTPSAAATFLPIVVNWLITTPLVTAMTIYALLDLGEGRRPNAREAILRGLEIFTAVLVPVVLAALGIIAGLIALIVPGIYLAVRWYFVAQAVVVEERRGPAALQRSWELVSGSGWRVFGILIIASLAIGSATRALQTPFTAGASAANMAFIQLIGVMVTQILAAPAGAVIGALLYFDLRTRKELMAGGWGGPGGQWGYQQQWPPPPGQPPPPAQPGQSPPWPQQPRQPWPAQQPQPGQPPPPAPESPAPPGEQPPTPPPPPEDPTQRP